MKIRSIAALVIGLALPIQALAEDAKTALLYKNPQCGCCENYAAYLRKNGYDVTVKPTFDLAQISRDAGVPAALEGCHTMMIGDYVVEGHVPVDLIDRLLAEKPDIRGISLPGMPMGSPGMDGPKTGPLTIYEIPKASDAGAEPKVYATE